MTRGIDVRPKLVAEINKVARSLGKIFETLKFETGTIDSLLSESVLRKTSQQSERRAMEVMIALHACDTATDDALWAGICRKAAVICVAPCCQKELRPQIDMHHHFSTSSSFASNSAADASPHPLIDVLRYGIYRERFTETITDSMRGLLLEIAGYDVNVFEFIGGEHTSKNVMITAVRKPIHQQGNKEEIEGLRNRLRLLAEFHGVKHQKLATLMGQDLVSESRRGGGSHLSPRNMPPL